MIEKIKRFAIVISTILLVSAPGLIPAAAYAAGCGTIGDQVVSGANGAATGNASGAGNIGDCNSATATSDATSSLAKIAQSVTNIFSYIVGAISIIMIIYGGFRYITSGGDSGSVGNAKNTIIYAIIGLIIVALAQVIVHFVLNQSSQVSPTG